jgi:DinB superfamily
MKLSDIKILPAHHGTYIQKIEDIELTDALEKYGKPYFLAERDKFKQLGDKVYAPGKWTVRDIVQHLIDAERIFAYRALRFARNDKTPLTGFEENDYAVTAQASRRSLDEILEELFTVRQTTMQLFKSFTDEMLMREGQMPSGSITVLGIGFAIVGHNKHHMEVLKERYYGLI